jgi:hypothetical protein
VRLLKWYGEHASHPQEPMTGILDLM